MLDVCIAIALLACSSVILCKRGLLGYPKIHQYVVGGFRKREKMELYHVELQRGRPFGIVYKIFVGFRNEIGGG